MLDFVVRLVCPYSEFKPRSESQGYSLCRLFCEKFTPWLALCDNNTIHQKWISRRVFWGLSLQLPLFSGHKSENIDFLCSRMLVKDTFLGNFLLQSPLSPGDMPERNLFDIVNREEFFGGILLQMSFFSGIAPGNLGSFCSLR